MRITRRKKLFIASIAAVGLMGGSALAYWTTGGTGPGLAKAGDAVAVTITQDNTVTGLRPGGPAAPLDFTITNGSIGDPAQYITDVVITKGAVTKAIGAPAGPCTAADFIVVQPTLIPADIPGGDTAYPSGGTGGNSATIRLDNTTSNQDGCKGAEIALTYTAS